MEEKRNSKIRSVYRFSLHPEMHKDVIDMLEERTKTERPQLFVAALRYFQKHCTYVEKTGDGNAKENAPPETAKTVDVADIFHFQQT
jgi:hypothetical protein